MKKKARREAEKDSRSGAEEPAVGEPREAEGPRATVSEQELAEIEARASERDQYFDRYMRARAELANFRKRVERERREARDLVAAELVRDILPALDDFQRALDHARETSDFEGLANGVELVERKLLKTLEDFGIRPIEAEGRPFDPAVHEAVTMIEAPGTEPGTVVEELRKGYLLGDRVVRPSQVVVSESSRAEGPGGGGDESLDEQQEEL
jgi:molecular chaperone GrpE